MNSFKHWWFNSNLAFMLQILLTLLGIALLVGGVVKGCTSTEGWKEHVRQEEAQERKDAQPRVINEVDGCKVYAFKGAGHWQYFTRCQRETSTTSNWSESRGKTRIYLSNTTVTENQ